MTHWIYKIPRLMDAPEALRGKSRYSEDMQLPRIGLYCEDESHAGAPWLICSFVPNYAHLEQSGDKRWTVSDKYRTGTGDLLHLSYVQQQLISDDLEPAPQDANGRLFTGEKWQQGYGRWNLGCKSCGNSLTMKSDSFQSALFALFSAGVMEISIDGLRSMNDRLKGK
ncbi:hypothetical protein [Glutamicibacter soli]|uniref:hypothetical protein n=1 Tax=Glutamicibacter soli TaxID=453836 RepID=UPI0011BEFE01|nr:hypothetical protein [Glutamicibacter soli]